MVENCIPSFLTRCSCENTIFLPLPKQNSTHKLFHLQHGSAPPGPPFHSLASLESVISALVFALISFPCLLFLFIKCHQSNTFNFKAYSKVHHIAKSWKTQVSTLLSQPWRSHFLQFHQQDEILILVPFIQHHCCGAGT